MKLIYQASLLTMLTSSFVSTNAEENPDSKFDFINGGAHLFILGGFSNGFLGLEANVTLLSTARFSAGTSFINPAVSGALYTGIEVLSPKFTIPKNISSKEVELRLTGGYTWARYHREYSCNPINPLFGDPICEAEVNELSTKHYSAHAGIEASQNTAVFGIRLGFLLKQEVIYKSETVRSGISEENPNTSDLSPDYHTIAIYGGIQF